MKKHKFKPCAECMCEHCNNVPYSEPLEKRSFYDEDIDTEYEYCCEQDKRHYLTVRQELFDNLMQMNREETNGECTLNDSICITECYLEHTRGKANK